DATADANGTFHFDRLEALPAGTFVTATATVFGSSNFTTSGFSNALRVGEKADPHPAPPPPTPTPTPTPGRSIVASFLLVGKKKKVLLVVVRFADNGQVKGVFRSPFQNPPFHQIRLTVVSSRGDGVNDTVVLTAVLNGKKKIRIIRVA